MEALFIVKRKPCLVIEGRLSHRRTTCQNDPSRSSKKNLWQNRETNTWPPFIATIAAAWTGSLPNHQRRPWQAFILKGKPPRFGLFFGERPLLYLISGGVIFLRRPAAGS
jgi:hypothetical protein